MGHAAEAALILEGFREKDRAKTLGAFTDEVLHELGIGDAAHGRAEVARYARDEVDVPVVAGGSSDPGFSTRPWPRSRPGRAPEARPQGGGPSGPSAAGGLATERSGRRARPGPRSPRARAAGELHTLADPIAVAAALRVKPSRR